MNKFLLKLIMLPSALWQSLGADVEQLRAILTVRLLLDDRKPLTMMRGQRQKKNSKFSSIVSVFMMLVMGCFYMYPLFLVPDRIFSLTIYFSLLLMIVTFMLITDFSSVLFDSRDKFIIFPRPVTDRTIVLARMLHVFIYLFRLVFPLSLPGLVALCIMDGWRSASLFLIPVLLLTFLALFVVNIIYLLVLRLVKPERFKDVINYFQIITSIVFFATVYLLPRAFDHSDFSNFSITTYSWVKFAPSYWLAACWSWVGYPVLLSGTAFFSAFAVLVPVLCMYIMVKWLSPEFSRRIAGIDASDVVPVAPVAVKRSSGNKLYKVLANLFNRTDEARAGFMLAWLQSGRSRSFRMRVYPSFAFIPIYFIFITTKGGDSIAASFHKLGTHRHNMLIFLYMASFVMVNAMNYVTISDQYKAAWVYYSTPLATPGRLMAGAFKAMWTKFFLPFFLLIAAFVIYIWGIAALSDCVLAIINVSLFFACIARINFCYLPFSIMEQMQQRGGRIIKSMLGMFVPVILGFGHFIFLDMLWMKLIFMGLSGLLLWLVWDSYVNISWKDIANAEVE